MESREVVDSSTEQPPDNKQTSFSPSLPPLSTSFPPSPPSLPPSSVTAAFLIFVLQLLNSLTLSNKLLYCQGKTQFTKQCRPDCQDGAGCPRIWGKDIMANNGFAA